MTDSQIRLYSAISNIDDDIIEEVHTITKKSNSTLVRVISLAASFCVVLVGAILLFSQNRFPNYPAQSTENRTPVEQERQPSPSAIESMPTIPDYSEINFSGLSLPRAQVDSALLEQFADYSIDILPFSEDFLSECCGILEGTIKRIYPKHYTFDYYDDKFGELELYHSYSDSIIYELEIEKVWYGADFTEGTTILVEDQFYFPDSYFALMEGRCYVLPIFEYGDTVMTFATGEIASGDLSRDSIYSTEYPFHPQITRTEDGCYLVTTDWTSLTADPCRVVNMDSETEYEGFLNDNLRLVYADDFSERLMTIIHAQLEVSDN